MSSFKSDKTLHCIDISNIKIVSFDIFDTLVYRLCAEPKSIFYKVGKAAIEKYGEHFFYSPKTFQSIRCFAEENARKALSHQNDVTLEDIYQFLPFSEEQRIFLMKEELKHELQNLVLNERVYSFLRYCYEKEKKIILISDMYLSKEQLKYLLLNIGMDTNILEDVYVSTDLNLTKAKGDLFDKVLSFYPTIPPCSFLHIGDNYGSDVINAQLRGMEAIHYSPILENMFSIYEIESSLTATPIDELRSLRKLVGHTAKYEGEELRWYQMGAQIFGPVYTLFSEWIVEFAKKTGKDTILPLMREGLLLSKLVKNTIENEGLYIKVEPLYISRKATFLAGFEKIEEKDIHTVLNRKLLRLNDLFNLFLLPIENPIFLKYKNITIKESMSCMEAGKSLYEHLKIFLTQKDILRRINENAFEQRNLLKEYILTVARHKSFLTVDIGGNGTIQNEINKVVADSLNTQHLFLAGTEKALEGTAKGKQFISWLGFSDEYPKMVKQFFRSPEIIEAMTNIMQAGTSHYARLSKENSVIPILNSMEYSKEQCHLQYVCWQGILDFQAEWFKVKKKYPIKDSLLKNREGFLAVFHRLITLPMEDEARMLGSLTQDDQVHYSRSVSIVREEDVMKANEMGLKDFLIECSEGYMKSQVYWPQGVVAHIDSKMLLQQYCKNTLKDRVLVDIIKLVENIDKNRYKHITIYGAGEIGMKVLQIAEIYNLPIQSFIDMNYVNMKNGFYGLPVHSLSSESEYADMIIIASKAFKDEIRETIIEFYASKKIPRIIEV